jgi:hypothetical protein
MHTWIALSLKKNAATEGAKEMLRTGDLVLFSSRGVLGGLIRFFTRSVFTHVGMVLVDPPFGVPAGTYLWESGFEPVPDPQQNRVILAGYGRVGRLVGEMLKRHAIPYIALDSDPVRVAEQRRQRLAAICRTSRSSGARAAAKSSAASERGRGVARGRSSAAAADESRAREYNKSRSFLSSRS